MRRRKGRAAGPTGWEVVAAVPVLLGLALRTPALS